MGALSRSERAAEIGRTGSVSTLDLLRLILARDGGAPAALDRWDAAAWEDVHRAIEGWDAAPLAYAAVRAAKVASRVPAPILEEWRLDHTRTTAVNLRLAFEANALVEALAKVGARAAPLKGTALFALGVYRDPGCRPTCDVDLLIAAEQGAAVLRLLQERGYVQSRGGGPKHWAPLLRDGLMVEVHEHAFWSLADGHRVRLPEMLAADRRPALAMVVAHLLHHLFESSVTMPWLVVKTLADLAEVRAFAAAERGSAEEVAETAARLGLAQRLGAVAGLLEKATDQAGPGAWMREARPGEVAALLARCAPRARRADEALRLPDRVAAFARMPFAEQAAVLRYHLLPPAETMRALYGLPAGSPWVWPLYPLRPAHLLARSAADAARLLAGKRKS